MGQETQSIEEIAKFSWKKVRSCRACGVEFNLARKPAKREWGIFCSKRCAVRSRKTSLRDRFLRRVLLTEKCWEWQGDKTVQGYGRVWSGKSQNEKFLAHRVAYELFIGPIANGYLVCHKCDNPPCVRPDHLFLGTAKDNSDDASRKGRLHGAGKGRYVGEAAPYVKLKECDVIRIRALRSRGMTISQINREYRYVSAGALYDIVNRRNWRHIA